MREIFTGVGAIALVVALTLSTAGAASAAPVNWSLPTTLSSGAGVAANAQVVTDGTTVTAIWSAFEGPFHRVQTSSSPDGGATWPPAVTLWTDFIGEEGSRFIGEEEGGDLFDSGLFGLVGQPQLVRAGATITAIWTAFNEGDPRVQTSYSADEGLTWSEPSVFKGFDAASFSPQLVAHGERITAIWTAVVFDIDEDDIDGDRFRLQTSTWADDGDGWSDPVFIIEEDFGSFNPQLVTDGDTITAIWNAYDNIRNAYDNNGEIQTSTWADDVDGWSDPHVLSDAAPHPFTFEDFLPEGINLLSPQLVRDGNTITAIWIAFGETDEIAFGETDETLQIQTSFSADNGDTWSDPVFIPGDGQPSFTPQLVSDDGIVTAIWLAFGKFSEAAQIQTSTWAKDVDGWSVPDVIGTIDLEGFPIDLLFLLSPQLVSDRGTITAIWSAFGETDEAPQIQTSFSADNGDTWSDPVFISRDGQPSFTPQLVSDDGIVTAIWSAFDGVTEGIQTSSLASNGEGWSDPVVISDVGGVGLDPQLVTDGDTITAIWIGFDDSVAFGGSQRIQTSYSADNGDTWSEPVFISPDGQKSFDSQLVTDGDTITAIWAFEGETAGIQTSSSTDGGANWIDPVVISRGDAGHPQLVRVRDTITAIWKVVDDDGAMRIQTSSSADSGANWTLPVFISGEVEDSSNPQLVTDGDTITAIWVGFDDPDTFFGDERIQTSSSADNGDTWSAPVFISGQDQLSTHPRLVSVGGTITAIWSASDLFGGVRVQTASSFDRGANWSVPVFLSGEDQESHGPQLVSDGVTVTAIWSAWEGGNETIQTSFLTDGGANWSEPESIFVDEEQEFSFDPQLVSDGNTMTAIWKAADRDRSLWIQTSSSSDGGRTWISPVTTLSADGPMSSFVDGVTGDLLFSNGGVETPMVTDGTTVTAIWLNPSTFRIQTSSAANVAPAPTPTRTPPAQLAATGVSDYFGLGVIAGGLLLSGFVALSFKSRQRGVFLRD